MTLQNIIRTIPNWQTKTASELRSDLLAEITKQDRTLYTGKHVINVIGKDAYRQVAGTIQAAAAVDPLASDARFWLGSEGLDFSDQKTQDMLDELAAAGRWSAELLTALKRIGRPVVTYYASQGGSGDVPSEAVIALERDKASKEDAAIDRLQAYREALPGWDGDPETEPVL